jgi:hypothetical protein
MPTRVPLRREEIERGVRKLPTSLSPVAVSPFWLGVGQPPPSALNDVYTAVLAWGDYKEWYEDTQRIEVEPDLTKYWLDYELLMPQGINSFEIACRKGLRYGFVSARVLLPNLAGQGYRYVYQPSPGSAIITWPMVMFCALKFRGDSYPTVGMAGWALENDPERNVTHLEAYVGDEYTGYVITRDVDISFGPNWADWNPCYWVKVNKHQIWLGMNEWLCAVFILLRSSDSDVEHTLYDNTLPYSIRTVSLHTLPEVGHPWIEAHQLFKSDGKAWGIELPDLGWRYYTWYEGDPCPPLTLPLYREASGYWLAGTSISSGSVTSHPIPTYGYSNKTLYFQANKAGTLEIQVYTLSGNWRSYDSKSVSAGSLLWYKMEGDAVLARVIFTPSSYPCTIQEAEVVMSE